MSRKRTRGRTSGGFFKKQRPARQVEAEKLEEAVFQLWALFGPRPNLTADEASSVVTVVNLLYARIDELMPEWADE